MTIKSKIEKIEQNIAKYMQPADQQNLVNTFKEQISLKLDECADYYIDVNSPMGLSYSITSAKQSLEAGKSQGILQLYAELHDLNRYQLPFFCNDIFEIAINTIKGKIGNLLSVYEDDVCSATNNLHCTLGQSMDDAFGQGWINS